MTGYIVETLLPVGWRRPCTVFYRYAEAVSHAESRINDFPVQAVRILSFVVNESPVFSRERDKIVRGGDA